MGKYRATVSVKLVTFSEEEKQIIELLWKITNFHDDDSVQV